MASKLSDLTRPKAWNQRTAETRIRRRQQKRRFAVPHHDFQNAKAEYCRLSRDFALGTTETKSGNHDPPDGISHLKITKSVFAIGKQGGLKNYHRNSGTPILFSQAAWLSTPITASSLNRQLLISHSLTNVAISFYCPLLLPPLLRTLLQTSPIWTPAA
jgi:hypothetical protein